MTAERDEIRLGLAPVGQRRGPLLRPTQIEDLLARLDHAAIDGPGDHLRYLVRRDGDHRLVEQGHSLDDPSLRDQRPALNVAGDRHQLDVTEPIADLGGPTGDRMGARPVSLDRALQGHRHEQMPLLRAVVPRLVEQPACSREPAAGAGELAAVHQDEHQPARAPDGPRDVTPAQELAMRALPHLDAVLVPAEEIRRRGEPLRGPPARAPPPDRRPTARRRHPPTPAGRSTPGRRVCCLRTARRPRGHRTLGVRRSRLTA